MQSLEIILTQMVISLVVVALYHLWSSRNKHPAAPNLNFNLNPNPNLNLPSVSPVIVPGLVVTRPTPPKPAPVPAPQPEPAPPEIIAAIAAAITVVLGPHRVVAIQQVAAPPPELNVWALEGRMKHFMSHKVR